MLLGAPSQLGACSSLPYAFTPLRPSRSRALVITAAVKKRPPAQRSASKQRPAPRGAKQSSPAPSRGLGGLFGGAKRAASQPKQAAKKAAKEVKKAAPVRKAVSAGTKRVGAASKAIGSQKAGGTKRIGTNRAAGTSRIGVKRGAPSPPPGRIQFDEDTSSTLGAAGVFSLGLATAAFLLFSVFTGIEGTAEAEQVLSSATQSVKSAVKEVASIAEGADNQEDTKIANLANKAKEAAGQVPSQARSAPSPQTADASPTGKAGIFGFGGQKPSAAEDTQTPNVASESKQAVEGKNPTPTSTKPSDSSSQPAFNLANVFGQAKNEVSSVAAADTADNQEDTKIANLANKAKDAASQVPSQARSSPSPQVADSSPTGNAGIFGLGGQKPSQAEDSQVPSVAQGSKNAVTGNNPTPTSANLAQKATNEVAKVADDTPLDDAAEAARTLVPSPDGLVDPEKRAQNAEAQEKRAVDAPESSFRAASPVGGEGEVSNLADQGLKGNSAFEEAAKKLKASSAEQFKEATEVDKQLQAEDDFKRAAQFRSEAPGSSAGNSVISRTEKQITGATSDRPTAPGASVAAAAGKGTPAAPNNNLLIGGGLVVAGVIAAAVAQGSGGADALKEQAGQAAESVKQESSSGGGGGGTGDVKEDIANRKKDAQSWIDDWKSRTGGK